jgi:hypothetical protein
MYHGIGTRLQNGQEIANPINFAHDGIDALETRPVCSPIHLGHSPLFHILGVGQRKFAKRIHSGPSGSFGYSPDPRRPAV